MSDKEWNMIGQWKADQHYVGCTLNDVILYDRYFMSPVKENRNMNINFNLFVKGGRVDEL